MASASSARSSGPPNTRRSWGGTPRPAFSVMQPANATPPTLAANVDECALSPLRAKGEFQTGDGDGSMLEGAGQPDPPVRRITGRVGAALPLAALHFVRAAPDRQPHSPAVLADDCYLSIDNFSVLPEQGAAAELQGLGDQMTDVAQVHVMLPSCLVRPSVPAVD
jgi:hypothetical protein